MRSCHEECARERHLPWVPVAGSRGGRSTMRAGKPGATALGVPAGMSPPAPEALFFFQLQVLVTTLCLLEFLGMGVEGRDAIPHDQSWHQKEELPARLHPSERQGHLCPDSSVHIHLLSTYCVPGAAPSDESPRPALSHSIPLLNSGLNGSRCSVGPLKYSLGQGLGAIPGSRSKGAGA